jgi:putative aldouronate transport system substrate-binding protein
MGKSKTSAIALFCVAMMLTACSRTPSVAEQSEKIGKTATPAQAKVSAPGTYPIVAEKETLKVFTAQDPYVEDLTTNEFTKWYEEKTNIKVDWTVSPQPIEEKVNITLAGGNLPDVFMMSKITPSQLVSMGSQGVFLPLNDLIDRYAPNIKKMMTQAPYLKEYMVAPDGKIYGLPSMNEVLHSTMPKKLWIYKPWLDELKLKVPTTLEEFRNVMLAFKAKDSKIVPLAGANTANNDPVSYFMQSFIYYDDANYLQKNGNKVEFVADKPEYKQGLMYLNSLVKDKTLQAESFIQDRKALTALAEAPEGSKLGAATSLFWGHFTVKRGDEYVPVPILAGPDGKRYGMDRGFVPTQQGAFVITKDAKNPEAAIRWIDWFYSTENKYKDSWSSTWGKEGVGWKRAEAGVKAVTGEPATYQALIPFGTKTNIRWSQLAPTFESTSGSDYAAVSPTDKTEERLYKATVELYKPFSAIERKVPFMFFSGEDLSLNGDLFRNISNVVKQFQVKFITGALSLENEKDWNDYIKELNAAGLKQYIEIYQRNLDAAQKVK